MKKFSVRLGFFLCENKNPKQKDYKLIQLLHKVIWCSIVVQAGVLHYGEVALAGVVSNVYFVPSTLLGHPWAHMPVEECGHDIMYSMFQLWG